MVFGSSFSKSSFVFALSAPLRLNDLLDNAPLRLKKEELFWTSITQNQ
jgi:hypothetical protein